MGDFDLRNQESSREENGSPVFAFVMSSNSGNHY